MSAYHNREVEFFPVHTLKRVDRPTAKILDDQVRRVDERESGFKLFGVEHNLFERWTSGESKKAFGKKGLFDK